MFDTLGFELSNHPSREILYNNITVKENKAPTDESIRLLNEFQQKAIENIGEKIVLNDNVINGCAIYYNLEYLNYDHVIYFRFVLNGKTYKDCIKTSDIEYQVNKYKLIKLLYQKISEKIAELFMTDVIKEMKL